MKPPEQEVPPQEKQEIIPILEETLNKVVAASEELDPADPEGDILAATQYLEETIDTFNQELEMLKGVANNIGSALEMLRAGRGGDEVKQQLDYPIIVLSRLLGR